MRKVSVLFAALIVCLYLAANAFAQTGNAQLGGIVQDPTKALIPGVTITATNSETGVTQTQLTNESGAYSFPVLQPGPYRVSAELSGFKKEVFNDVRLVYAGQSRLDFTMQVGTAAQSVEVTVAADSILRESSASVGNVLTQDRVQDLPFIGNNVFDLLATLPGINISTTGEQNNTIGGLGLNSINVTRDGLSTVDTRYSPETVGYATRVFSPSTMLPDLVGEVRLILSPVDAELGRGNAQIQIRTRSGTNRYNGFANWDIQNSALNANTWTNNHTPFTDPNTGAVTNHTTPAWNNIHQYTVAYGGPVQIPGLYDGKNKTFFYGLFEQNIRNTRNTQSVAVLTDTAREGIFRYFTGYNPSGFLPAAAIANQTFPLTASTASWVAVDLNGNPVRPLYDPASTPTNLIPYSGKLVCFSVFGTRRLDTNGNMVPFTTNDCPGGSISVPSAASGLWDPNRPTFDTSGYIKKILALTPHANYFGAGDGLNAAQFRWQLRRDGSNSNASAVGADLASDNKQYNIKIDHNFSARHKAAFSYTYQKDNSAGDAAVYPGGINGRYTRTPYVITLNVTSTLSSRMINEARFGLNHNNDLTYPAWFSPDPSVRQKAEDLLMPGAVSTLNPNYTYKTVVGLGLGIVSASGGPMATTVTYDIAHNPLWNYADTLSWSTGKHSFKFGGELRMPRTAGNGVLQPYPSLTLGNASATATPAFFTTATNFATELPGLLNAAPTGGNVARTDAQNMLYYLSGSVASVTHPYWITGSKNVTGGLWSDYSTSGDRIRNQIWHEWAAFVKDDYKITRRLTLNLGVRYEYVAPPFIEGGLTANILGYGYGAFGATRTAQSTLAAFNKDPFSIFLRPGNLYLSGYGSNATNPLACTTGVANPGSIPASTCDPNSLSAIQFVGPGSPNPGITSEPVDYYNIGPAVGFAYQLPWFGEGKTTIRGGYQQTFGAAGQARNNVPGGTEAEIANAPGATTNGTLANNISNSVYQSILGTRAITLADVKALVPTQPNLATPGGVVTVYGRSVAATVYDPNYHTPYTQNVNLSITRQIKRNVTLDIRYIGTFARRQKGSFELDTANVYHNPELLQALNDARAGTCTPNADGYASYRAKGINPCDTVGDPVLLDQMLAGLNLNNTVAGFGAVGTIGSTGVFQSGAEQMRRSGTFQANLANGDFNNVVVNGLLGLAPSLAQGRQAAPIDPKTGAGLGGINQIGLRNGCDRIANGFTIVQQTTAGGAQVANTGAAIPLRCFPEDYLINNPQFSAVTYTTNLGHTNYHSLQVGFTARPINGISTQATWVWAKSMQLPGSGYFDISNRNANFGAQQINQHSLRMNGTVELPIGPNKLLFGNSHGWMGRVLERWQTSFIANMASGTPASISPGTSHCLVSCRYNVQPGWVQPHGTVEWNVVNATTGAITGSYYGNPSPFIGVPDPQCLDPKTVTPGDKMGTSLVTSPTGTAVCGIFALAKRNPDGTAGDYLLTYTKPGEIGNSGSSNVTVFGQWSLDMNASKTFRITESKTVQLRLDATDVLNHPVPMTPALSAGGVLGSISGKGNQIRQLQAQLRFQF